MRRALLAALVTTSLCVLAPSDAVSASPKRHETAVETLHRKGVHCMEVLERRDCAIEKFEAVLDERSVQRELMTDSMLRLIKLYEKEEDLGQTQDVLRRFWDIGMKRRSTGHVPYTARYFPSELNILVNVNVNRIVDAPVTKALGKDVVDFVFTCDEALRNDIRIKRRWRSAKKQAALDGRKPHEVYYERLDKAEAARKARESKRKGNRSVNVERKSPIFVEAACPIAKALGHDSLAQWTRMLGAMNHQNFQQSMAVAEIPNLDNLLAKAVKESRLRPHSRDRWILPDLEYAGGEVHLARLDKNELMVAPAAAIGDVITARRKRRKRMNREVAKLLGEVPRDTGFFFVMNQAAVRELGLGGLKKSTRGVLEALLPKPKGIQIAGVFYEQFGLFTRMPTDQQVKGRMLVTLANTLIGRAEDDDPEAQMWLENLDIAEAKDRRALLATYVLSQRQLEKLMWESN